MLLRLNIRTKIRKPEEEKDNADSTKQKQVPEETVIISTLYVTAQSYDQVLLSTTKVNMRNEYSVSMVGQVMLFDFASQCNFVTKSMVQILKYKKATRISHDIRNWRYGTSGKVTAVTLTINLRFNIFALTIPCLVVAKIMNISYT